MANQKARDFFGFYFCVKGAGGHIHSSQGKSLPPHHHPQTLNDSPAMITENFIDTNRNKLIKSSCIRNII